MTSKHVKPSRPSDKDLDMNPGIGQSKGLNRFDGIENVAGENTVVGDVDNDTNRFGAIKLDQRARENR